MDAWIDAFKVLQPFLLESGTPVVVSFLFLYFTLQLFNKPFFIEFLKFFSKSQKRNLAELNETIDSLCADDPLIDALKKERRAYLFGQRYKTSVTEQQINQILEVERLVGDSVSLLKIVKAIKFFGSTDDTRRILRKFNWRDVTHYYFFNTVSLLICFLGFSGIVFFYIDSVFPVLEPIAYSRSVAPSTPIILSIIACFLIVVMGLLLSSITWPYRYTREIKTKLKKMSASSDGDDSVRHRLKQLCQHKTRYILKGVALTTKRWSLLGLNVSKG